MTIRDLANAAAKHGYLDAKIIIHDKDGLHGVDQVGFVPIYYANTPQGRVKLKNATVITPEEKPKKFVDRGSEDGYLELED